MSYTLYNAYGHKLRSPTVEKAQFVTALGIADMLTGIPLLIFPELVMPLLGWSAVDPIASRVVGAALMGIGIESWLGRNANIDVFRTMLNLKVIWSSSAILGIGLGIWKGGPQAGWFSWVSFLSFGASGFTIGDN